MNSPEIKSEQNKDVEYVNSKKLSCAGVEGPLGHPKVYLDICLLYTSPSPRD